MAEHLLIYKFKHLIDRTLMFHLSVKLNYFRWPFKCRLVWSLAITQTCHLYNRKIKNRARFSQILNVDDLTPNFFILGTNNSIHPAPCIPQVNLMQSQHAQTCNLPKPRYQFLLDQILLTLLDCAVTFDQLPGKVALFKVPKHLVYFTGFRHVRFEIEAEEEFKLFNLFVLESVVELFTGGCWSHF